MIAWCIVLLVLLLILTFPVGLDAAYNPQRWFIKLKLGPFRLSILPSDGEKKKKEPKKEETKPEQPGGDAPKKRPKLTLDDILTLLEIGLDALRRTFRHLSIDRFYLSWTAAADDPYDAVQQYGRVNAILGTLAGPAHRGLSFRDEDVRTDLDLTAASPVIDGQIILSIQIWEILLIAICALAALLKWYLNKKRAVRAETGDARKELV